MTYDEEGRLVWIIGGASRSHTTTTGKDAPCGCRAGSMQTDMHTVQQGNDGGVLNSGENPRRGTEYLTGGRLGGRRLAQGNRNLEELRIRP
jgi:hypothetical protein